MGGFDSRFNQMYAAQTRTLGIAIVATITGYGVNVPAILGEIAEDQIYVEGGNAESGGYELQVKASSLSGEPVKRTVVTCNGDATGEQLQITNITKSAGIYTLRLEDFASY